MSLLVILLRAILHPPWEMRRKAHLGCTNAPCVPVAGIAKSRRFGRLAAPIQAKLSRPTIGAALALPFDKATSTSASVSPTTDVGATPLRDVEEPEAQLVVGTLAPVQTAGADDAGLVMLCRVIQEGFAQGSTNASRVTALSSFSSIDVWSSCRGPLAAL